VCGTMESHEGKIDSKLFWVISIPNNALSAHGLEGLKARVRNFCISVQRFNIPNLRVGTLDSLMALSDELVKKDQFLEITTKKIARQLVDLYVNENMNSGAAPKGAKQEKIALMVNGVNVDTYLHQFQWDEAKYKLSSPLSDIVDAIMSTVAKLDEELRAKSSSYQQLAGNLLAEKRKKAGNLLVRDFTELVQQNPDIYVDSPNLVTLFVVVSKHQSREWEKCYEELLHDDNLGGGVVPGSSTLLAEDTESNLYTVVIFKRLVGDFKQEARKKKFTVRDWSYNPENASSGAEEQKKQENKRLKQKENLIRWCRLNFAEAFIAWAHLKAIRVFVETILRYGLPADFTAVLIEPAKKQDKKLRLALDGLYKGIGSVYLQDDKEEDEDPEAGHQTEKFYSYVWTQIRVALT